ncbi:GGDEF/EAL domain-containing response regulator [Propylenella binzhouense]|uniref:EAL domain-containing protein n=1 Tax=Propylenella binzhouense TaxID=2555902 RepID=A0A964T481_9HYPH|nr:EAL domain-containing protein [Propylenella binzhouense]MYZ48196.1 EAL domain-containing protein [Propylenella binzhouense]
MALIVILDDRATNRQIFTRLAATIDADVVVKTFEDPLSALAWMTGNVPDLVITDYKMPNIDGAEFTRRFREQPGCADVPVIVITVYEERSFRHQALEAGATDFLQSPVDHSEFVTRARNLLKLRHQQLLLEHRASDLERALQHSEQSRAEELRNSRERLAQVIDTVPAMISAVDRDGRCIFANACHISVQGNESGAARGPETARANRLERKKRHSELDAAVLRTGEALPSFEEEVIDLDGRRRHFITTKSPLRETGGEVASVLTTSLEITERKQAEAHLVHLVHHDPLTDLPNRVFLSDRLSREIPRARAAGREIALHLLDLDHFKSVNDVLGHSRGDELLKIVGSRLSQVAGEGDVVARLGGDEFAILQTQADTREAIEEMAKRVSAAVSRPAVIEGHELDASVSLGTTVFPGDGDSAEELLKTADLAMYRAKAQGGGAACFFLPEMRTKAREAILLDAELRRGIDQKQFLLFYQPQVDVRTGQIVGAEALLRWNRPGHGIVQPGAFLDRAEANGLIVPINEWVLHEACHEAQRWLRSGLPALRVAVNMSPLQFRRQDVCELVTSALRETGLDPRRLELELTENIVMENVDSVVFELARLRKLGVQFSLDDFGTGYSSFKYVKRFPIDRLKIDQYFIRAMSENDRDLGIVRAIIGMARSLDFAVTAEGVETHEQMELLTAEKCDEVQGYFFSRPLPAEEFVALVRSQMRLANTA